jgi:hypothetical protein
MNITSEEHPTGPVGEGRATAAPPAEDTSPFGDTDSDAACWF